MPSRIVSPALDMLNAVARIRRILEGVALEEIEEDGDKRWLVERGIKIISEARRHLTIL